MLLSLRVIRSLRINRVVSLPVSTVSSQNRAPVGHWLVFLYQGENALECSDGVAVAAQSA